MNDIDVLKRALEHETMPPFDTLESFDDRQRAIDLAIASPTGRRWLRGLDELDTEFADRLLSFEDEFRSSRRDSTLERAVERASLDAVIEHKSILASGPAAGALWNRLAVDPALLSATAQSLISSGDAVAAENTLYLLVLDLLNPYQLDASQRSAMAESGLASSEPAIRSLAAEYLFDHDVPSLAASIDRLVLDSDERVRGLAWSAGFRVDPDPAFDAATSIVADESAHLPVRRSALAALGTHYQTSDLVELLSVFVTHPDERLALDAGNLLYRLHRHPTIATAAAASPHQSVREIGEFLLDPYRGSPAAGGSRPGDPTTSDIFAEMIRQTEVNDTDDGPG